MEGVRKIINEAGGSLEDPQFYQRTFGIVAHAERPTTPVQAALRDQEGFSQRLESSSFQEGAAVRNVTKARRIAKLLIDDGGELDQDVLLKLISELKERLHSLARERRHDAQRQQHMLNVLLLLQNEKEYRRALLSASKPVSNQQAEQIIRDTLQLPSGTMVTDSHARRAVLSAWLTYLRQSVGSCFATALAIIIQSEQPKYFLDDIVQLLATGRLVRTFEGVEYSVPLSHSWGIGDLQRPVLTGPADVKVWRSPGLIAALEAAALFNRETPLAEKIDALRKLVIDLLGPQEAAQSYRTISADEIIRKILLKHHEIKEEDLKDYANREKGTLRTGSIVQIVTSSGRNRSKTEQCEAFLQRYEAAKTAFKSLSDNALLKSWEFTLASFSETKAEFARWNLYSSLGMNYDEPNGIGACLYEKIQRKMSILNEEVREHQDKYEEVFSQVQYLEGRMKRALTEEDLGWLKVEYASRMSEMNHYLDLRGAANDNAHKFADLFNYLIETYTHKFQDYFQEVYDAEMHDVAPSFYDDSPAGFRLLYKHGRKNPALWTMIYSPTEYVNCLAEFFVATEIEIASAPELEGLQQPFGELVTAIVIHVKTEEFMLSALQRMAERHGGRLVANPLNNLDKVDKKPWVYVSGGTVVTLMNCYYRRSQKAMEEAKWVENVQELVVFFLDAMRSVPSKFIQPFLEIPTKSILTYSPTHVFVLKPGLSPFKEGWQTDDYPYTWLKDNHITPVFKFLDEMLLDQEMVEQITSALLEKLPKNARHDFRRRLVEMPSRISPFDFRRYIADALRYLSDGALGNGALSLDEVDSTLYSFLPMTPALQVRGTIDQLLKELPGIDTATHRRILDIFDEARPSSSRMKSFSSENLQNTVKSLLVLATKSPTFPHDYHSLVTQAAQKLKLAMPRPIVIADTNWMKEYFAFVVNPGTGNYELWVTDVIGSNGRPMSMWKQWMDGSRRDKWGIYTRPYEYGG